MGLFSKKERVPELPPAPTLPEIPSAEAKKDLPELPSFPTSPKNEMLNQELVKSAVSDDMSPEPETTNPQFPTLPSMGEPSIADLPRESTPSTNSPPTNQGIPALPQQPKPLQEISQEVASPRKTLEMASDTSQPKKPMTQQLDPIFVRIDKFQSSQESFEKIKDKIREIEKTLESLKKVKSQEEDEVSKWLSEVEEVKSRLAQIDDNIFRQM